MRGAAILIEASPGEVRGALIRNGVVWDVVHHRQSSPSLMGASYRGRVRRVDPGINGAFVDIGTGQDAFLRARDAAIPGAQKARRARIAEILHEGAVIDVQVVADGFEEKGPRVARIATPEASPGTASGANVPAVLVPPADPVAHILERYSDDRISVVVCSDATTANLARTWCIAHWPELADRIERDRLGLFAEQGVEDAIADALARRVALPGGAELVFDQAEALCVIDINSGGEVGKAGRTPREVNAKAMPEIARQLRLRNIAGAIVIDALKMGSGDDRNRVLVRLRETLKGDPGSCHVLGMTNLGLIEMTRTRIGPTLAERIHAPVGEPAPAMEAIAMDALRTVIRTAAATPAGGYRLAVAPVLADFLEGRLQAALADATRHVGRLVLVREDARAPARFEVMLGSGEPETTS
jgi:ribonuclease G